MSGARHESDSDRLHPDVVMSTQHGEGIEALTCLSDGRGLVIGSDNGAVRVWNIDSCAQEGTEMLHERRISHLAVTRRGEKIVSADDHGEVKVWDVESHKLLSRWTSRNSYPRLDISPDGRIIAVGKLTVEIFTAAGRMVNSISAGLIDSLCFSPDGNKLACGTLFEVSVYNVNTGECILGPLKGHQNAIWSVLWSHDGSRIFSASLDKTIRCWNSSTGGQMNAWSGHTGWIVSLSLSPDGSTLASASWDKTVRFWDATTGNQIGQSLRHAKPVHLVSFTPSGEFVVSAGDNATIFLWKVLRSDAVETRVYSAQCCSGTSSVPLPPPNAAQVSSTEEALWPNSDQITVSLPPDTNNSSSVQRIVQSQGSKFRASVPPAPDLSSYIVKKSDGYIAGGGFGDVYRCWYLSGVSTTEVAVKAFRFRFATDEASGDGSLRMLRRELGIWRRLDHRNIVPFLGIAYGFGMHGAMSLVSLWMPNKSLHDFLSKYDSNLGVGHRLQLLLDVVNGLCYLHTIPIVHGDLNSNNVLLDADYTARLTDFGYASLVGNIPEALSYLQRSTVRPGALRWIAPEQVESEEMFQRTTKSDIYSFGCTALEVLSGKQPWSEVKEDVAVVLRLAKGQKPGRPQSQPIDDPHWNLIQRCWSSVEERPSVEVIGLDVQKFLNNHPVPQLFRESVESWSGHDNSHAGDPFPSIGQSTSDSARWNLYIHDNLKGNHEKPYDNVSERLPTTPITSFIGRLFAPQKEEVYIVGVSYSDDQMSIPRPTDPLASRLRWIRYITSFVGLAYVGGGFSVMLSFS